MNPTQLLQQHFGFSEFRPGQLDVIDALETHGAALAIFPTGAGKSLCYQLPALAYDGLTLVVSPLIALMKDQIDFLQGHGVAAERLDSSQSADEYRAITSKLRQKTLKLLYVAPERFNNEQFLEMLRPMKISLFAVDEAHCISEWGHNFRPDYLKIAETARNLGAERVLALTATATPAVAADICAAFQIPADAMIRTGFYRPNLNMSVTAVSEKARNAALLKRLKSRKPGPTIVYVTLQKTAELIAYILRQEGLNAAAYHAGMDSEKRTQVQNEWMASDAGIVVATIAFGMGIDKADVRYVYHYNLPKSLESYSQEVGRAGRDGQRSTVELLACPSDVPTLENFAYGDTPTETALRGLLDELLHLGDEFDISLYDLSGKYDIRQLVLRTILTYLELRGILRQGTPFYAGYEMRPLIPIAEIKSHFKGVHAQFVSDIFAHAKRGRTWYALNPQTVANALGEERRRVVRALEYFEEHAFVELKAAELRQRYTRLDNSASIETLTQELAQRFSLRETHDIARIQDVLKLVTQDSCQVNALVGYFGEIRPEPCGHCTFCATGKVQEMPPAHEVDGLSTKINPRDFLKVRASNPNALGHPRQAARFLCGLSSPALTQAKLGKHDLFGALEEYRFGDVLEWCESVE